MKAQKKMTVKMSKINNKKNMQEKIIEKNKIETKEEVKIESNYISIDDFLKVEIMLGTIKSVEEVEGSEKLYKLKVDFGDYVEVESEGGLIEKELKYRTVFSGIKKFVKAEDLLNKQFPFVTNLAPRKMMGEYSEAMILAASEDEVLALMSPTQSLKNGTKLK